MSGLKERVLEALEGVHDPEIGRPITELGMLREVVVDDDGAVSVTVALTVSGCPLREKIVRDVTGAVEAVDGVTAVVVDLDVMTDEQRTGLRKQLKGGGEDRVVPFAAPDSLTRVYCVASAKGGVGKSSVTANLAALLAARGLSVGVLDADIYGHSIPRALGVSTMPVQVEKMLMPPVGHGVKVISMGMFTEKNAPVLWRGPMLHRALEQFLVDVYWGDLDVLLIDMPPGTGDVQITLAQMVPDAESLVVTTPHLAAAEVAERAGTVALQTHQRIVGVIENMAWATLPSGETWEPFGSGGGDQVAEALTDQLGYQVPLLGRMPIEPRIGAGGDTGTPFVLGSGADDPTLAVLEDVASLLAGPRGLAGRRLKLGVG